MLSPRAIRIAYQDRSKSSNAHRGKSQADAVTIDEAAQEDETGGCTEEGGSSALVLAEIGHDGVEDHAGADCKVPEGPSP